MKHIIITSRWLIVIGLLLLGMLGRVQATPAPDFELPTEAGSIVLQNQQGQVVYLDFWASWCKPCRKSFPWMNAMQAKYHARGLQIIAVNVDADPQEAKRFLEKYPAEFIVAYDAAGKVASQYQVKGMPSAYLIDRQGNIHKLHIGFREEDKAAMESLIQQLLQN